METKERLEEGYRRERRSILAWLGERVGREVAEDALHDVVARALANLDSMEPLRDVGAWLWRAARNAAIDAWRSRARRRAAGETDPGAAGLGGADGFDGLIEGALRSAHDEAERAETLEALYAAIDALPAEQRYIVVAQAIRGETFASVSARTGTPVETLAARKRYATAKLRAALADYGN
ncbi:MAG: sigma-70 family RNA polymerase sigma factor [Spirochaetes bacterium]|nr:sigma-70 family RNA polymerase sigma factor [Spirochaetota bacterium]